MPTIAKITGRPIYIEDLSLSTSPDEETESADVMGVGTVPLVKIDMVRYSAFHQYANDAAAAAGGVPVGGAYYNTTYSFLHTRMS